MVEQYPDTVKAHGSSPCYPTYGGVMPTAGQLPCKEIVWVRLPHCPQNIWFVFIFLLYLHYEFMSTYMAVPVYQW